MALMRPICLESFLYSFIKLNKKICLPASDLFVEVTKFTVYETF